MQPKAKSIFDLIEERSATPYIFAWSSDLTMSKFTAEEFVYEGELITSKGPDAPLSKRRFVLTLNGLIKYKVCINCKQGNRNLIRINPDNSCGLATRA